MAKGYEIAVDLTQFSMDNEWPLEWVAQVERLIPVEAASNLSVVYLINANTPFRKFTKRFSR